MILLDPQITWLVKKGTEKTYISENEFYAGTYNKGNNLVVDLKLWNNRYGTTQVKDLINFGISIGFDSFEDNSLYKYISFIVNGKETIVPTLVDGKANIQIPREIILSGKVNDGSDQYTENYMTLKMIIAVPKDINIKPNDLKTISLDITQL